MKKLCAILVLSLAFSAISGKKELFPSGSFPESNVLKERLAGKAIGAILLERRDYDSTNHARIDGLVFVAAGTKYRYIRRLNDDHRLKINTAEGRVSGAARPEESEKYARMIAENKLFPHVLREKDGREVLTVYCPARLRITWSQEKNNEIYLELREPFQKRNSGFIPDDPFLRLIK